MPRVLNSRQSSENAVYVGRPTKWGNPFVIGRDGDRQEVIASYRTYILPRKEEIISELRGRNLRCWCAPLACHADVLLELANEVSDAS